MGKFERGIAGHFPVPPGFRDWHWVMSLQQARALTLGVEHFRALAPHCMGAIWWQLNDCWPVMSWSVIDGDGRAKPAWFALRHAFADRLIVAEPAVGGGVVVSLINDTDQLWAAPLRADLTDFSGAGLAQWLHEDEVSPRSVQAIHLPPTLVPGADATDQVVRLRSPGVRDAWYFAREDLGLDLPVPRCTITVQGSADRLEITIEARTFVRDLALPVDQVSPTAVVDDMLITMLPGERVRLGVTDVAGALPLAAEPWIAVLRCANDLVPGPGLR
jgi:beta-mannosidase